MAFTTTGIVSIQAKKYNVELSPCVDQVFFVEDTTWSGFIEGSDELSPTSKAMVEASDIIVSLGDGEAGRDEMLAARRSVKCAGLPCRYEPSACDRKAQEERAALTY